MIGGVQDAAKIPELRKRIFFTLLMLIIYRVGVFVPTPGIDAERLTSLFQRASNTIFGMVNMFSGGALEQFSVFALGIMPYISVSIIMQLLQSSSKRLEELSKEGEQGRRIITGYTRKFTILLAIIQGFIISIGLESQQGIVSDPGWRFRIIAIITLTAGTAFIMWIGEQVTEHGIGNGISLIIMAGILARMPSTLVSTFALVNSQEMSPGKLGLLFLFGIGIVAFIVFVERCQRRIPVQYPRRAMSGGRMTQAQAQHMPFKINSAGVLPPIFASALMLFPITIAGFVKADWAQQVVGYLTPGKFTYEFVFGLLNIFFCFFITAMQVDPEKIAENLKKNGGFIPTIRPGKDTANFLNGVLTRLTLWGGFYICAVCIIPSVFYIKMGASNFSFFFGGTAVLIVVGVTLDTVNQMQSHIIARNYEGFMQKGPGKMRGLGKQAMKGRLIQR